MSILRKRKFKAKTSLHKKVKCLEKSEILMSLKFNQKEITLMIHKKLNQKEMILMIQTNSRYLDHLPSNEKMKKLLIRVIQ
jgi:hypothetical protein